MVRVSGIDHTGPVQGRTEASRGLAKPADGPEPSAAEHARVPLRLDPSWLAEWGSSGPTAMVGEAIEGPSQVSSYTRVPATSFRSVLTYINTRSVCTLRRHPRFSFLLICLPPPPFAGHPFLFFFFPPFFLSFSPWFLFSSVLLCRLLVVALDRCFFYLFFFFLPLARSTSTRPSRSFGCSFFDVSARFCCPPGPRPGPPADGCFSVARRSDSRRFLMDELNESLGARTKSRRT